MAPDPTHPAEPLDEAAIRARRFPVQKFGTIPWPIADEAYLTYVRLFGRQQSLEHLADRGGFGVVEMDCLVAGCNPMDWPDHTPSEKLALRKSWTERAALLDALAAERSAREAAERANTLMAGQEAFWAAKVEDAEARAERAEANQVNADREIERLKRVVAMFQDPEFHEGNRIGMEQIERGESMTMDELKARLHPAQPAGEGED